MIRFAHVNSLAVADIILVLLVLFLCLNIKRRRKRYKILSEAKQKLDLLHAMIAATPDAVFIKDKEGRYLFVNPEAAYIIGKPVEDIVGKISSDFFPLAAAQAMIDDDNAVMASASSISYEEQSVLPDPSKCLLVTKGPMYNDQGEVDGIFIVARDITEIKQLQKENAEKVAQLETALANVRQLEGIIPICMHCKKIRDDEKSWHQLEKYISSHSEARFSHGICPECYDKQMLEINTMIG
jgi:PAS domain S-box-containing protein